MRIVLAANKKSALHVAIESHGREHAFGKLDISRTVSWFTSLYPLVLRPDESLNIGEDLKAIKNQLHSVGHQSMEYDLLRYLSTPERAASITPRNPPELIFNYMGQWQRMLSSHSQFSFARPIEAQYGSNRLLGSSFEVNAMVFDEELLIHWTYDKNRYIAAALESLGEQLIDSIAQLIEYCLHTEDNTLTPTDFNADIGQDDLDDIFAEFGED
jgi:non-ribosomal peptide synthase protein (TIGR01720 family)